MRNAVQIIVVSLVAVALSVALPLSAQSRHVVSHDEMASPLVGLIQADCDSLCVQHQLNSIVVKQLYRHQQAEVFLSQYITSPVENSDAEIQPGLLQMQIQRFSFEYANARRHGLWGRVEFDRILSLTLAYKRVVTADSTIQLLMTRDYIIQDCVGEQDIEYIGKASSVLTIQTIPPYPVSKGLVKALSAAGIMAGVVATFYFVRSR